MRIPRSLLVAGLCLSATLTPVLSGCSSDGGSGPSNSLGGDWDVTSFTALGSDAIANGMTFSMTLAGGDYTFVVTNDLIGVCDQLTDCTITGSYTQTGSTITFDPGDVDAVTLNFTLQGNNATLTGSIDGNAVTITMTKI